MKKNWKQITGYASYEISKNGNVRSTKSGKNLSIYTNNRGYKTICLRQNGKNQTNYMHILLAREFLPNPNGFEFLNFKNGDVSDISISNLEWSAKKSGLRTGEDNGRAVLTEREVNFIKLLKSEYPDIKSTFIASALGVSKNQISHILNGKRWNQEKRLKTNQ